MRSQNRWREAKLRRMNDSARDERFLDLFSGWLRTLGDDAKALGQLVASDDAPDSERRAATVGLNYLFKSLDLIPDGIDDLGFLDDAFVLRVASRAVSADARDGSVVGRLAKESELVEEFLGSDFGRLTNYVDGLSTARARGRTAEEIMSDGGVRAQFVGEVDAWAKSFAPPSFQRDPKTLIKLRAFLSAKLP